MPYVSIPKDLTKVKTKVVLNLTRRQLVCFGSAAAIGVPTYFLTRGIPALWTASRIIRGKPPVKSPPCWKRSELMPKRAGSSSRGKVKRSRKKRNGRSCDRGRSRTDYRISQA